MNDLTDEDVERVAQEIYAMNPRREEGATFPWDGPGLPNGERLTERDKNYYRSHARRILTVYLEGKTKV